MKGHSVHLTGRRSVERNLKDSTMKNFLAIYTDHAGNTKRQFVIASAGLGSLDVAEHVRETGFQVSKVLVRPLFDVEKVALGASRRAEAAALEVARSVEIRPVLALLDPESTDEMLEKLAKKLWSV